MRKITIFNTWITSENTGDMIIMDACYEILKEIFSDSFYVEIPTHTKLTLRSHNLMQCSDIGVVCGTNLLKSNMLKQRLWKVSIIDSFFIKNAVLLGVGWQNYSKSTTKYSKILWGRLLNDKYYHSVRDEYTKNKLEEMGIKNVLNTGCPTMWKLTEKHCEQIPVNKSKNVVTTITNYRKDITADNFMLEVLSKNYEKVFVWPQSYEDILYVKNQLSISKNVEIISPNLDSFNKILEGNLDFVGTRLHAGIRALQKKKRTIIIGIDNRAMEMKEMGLPVLNRKEINKLEKVINSSFETKLALPIENITLWKEQFRNIKKDDFLRKHILFYTLDCIKSIAKTILRK